MNFRVAQMLAKVSRGFPIEKGRWRLSQMAYNKFAELGDLGSLDQPVITTRLGFKMHLDLSEFVDRTIYCSGMWEELETSLILSRLKPGNVFVDAGAYKGYFSLLASQAVGAKGKAHAFEANPKTYRFLEQNIDLNRCQNVDLHGHALGKSGGVGVVRNSEIGNAGGDFVEFRGLDETNKQIIDGEKEGAIAVKSLDEVLGCQRVNFIKIDTEGAELKVLQGALGILIRRDAPDILFEFTPIFIRRSGDEPRELIELLKSAGYRLYYADSLKEVDDIERILREKQSYIFCTKD